MLNTQAAHVASKRHFHCVGVLAIWLLALAIAASPALANAQSNDPEARKAKARKLYAKGSADTRRGDKARKRGRRKRAMAAYRKAVDKFLRAYQLYPTPLLLFSLGQVYRSRRDRRWALACYQRFLERAEEDQDNTREARNIRKLIPKAKKQAAALKRKLGAKLKSPLLASGDPGDPLGVCYSEPSAEPEPKTEPEPPASPAPEVAATAPSPDLTPGSRSDRKRVSRTGSRIGFWSAAGLSVVGVGAAAVTLLQVRGFEDDQQAAANEYYVLTGQELDPNDACLAAQVALEGDPANGSLSRVVSACDAGRSRATMSNIFQGVAVVSAVAAGFFFYRGFLRKSPAENKASAVQVAPTVTSETVGARVLVRF